MRLAAKPSRNALMTGMPPATAASNASGTPRASARTGQFRAMHRQQRLVRGDHAACPASIAASPARAPDLRSRRSTPPRHRPPDRPPAPPDRRTSAARRSTAAIARPVARRNRGHRDRPAGARGDNVGVVRAAASARRRRPCRGRRLPTESGRGHARHASDSAGSATLTSACRKSRMLRTAWRSRWVFSTSAMRTWPVAVLAETDAGRDRHLAPAPAAAC